jgi:hypothetical protein
VRDVISATEALLDFRQIRDKISLRNCVASVGFVRIGSQTVILYVPVGGGGVNKFLLAVTNVCR